MLRNIEEIFPEWHPHPMTYASLHSWYEDAIRDCQSINDMKEQLLNVECPFVREAEMTYVLDTVQHREESNFTRFSAWLCDEIESCQQEQQEWEKDREQLIEQVQQYLKREEKSRRKAFEKQLKKDLKQLEQDLLSGRRPLPVNPPKSAPASANPPVFTQRNQVPLCKNTPAQACHQASPQASQSSGAAKAKSKAKAKANAKAPAGSVTYNFSGPTTFTNIQDNIHPTIQ